MSKLLTIALIILSAVGSLSSQGATRLWYFGTRAGIEFTATEPQPTTWVDTSYIAPGILHAGNGEALYFMLERRCIDGFGGIMRAEGGRIDTCPLQSYNSPQSVMFRLPGSNRFIYSAQSHASSGAGWFGTTPERVNIQDGAVTIHRIDLQGNAGSGSLEWVSQVLVQSLNRLGLSTMTQGSASQTVIPHSNGRDLWLIVPLMHPKQVWSFLVTPMGIDTSAKTRSPFELIRGFVNYPLDYLENPRKVSTEIHAK